jgi:hypothetical protein
MDWSSSGRTDTFRYVRVDRASFAETEVLDMVQDGGEVTYNDLTALKASGSVPLIGELDIANDYLRIYSISTLGGETEQIAHGTFLPSVPSLTLTSKRGENEELKTGTAALYSLLQLLAEQAVDAPYSVASGVNALGRAKSLIASVGLNVVADASTAVLVTAANFDAGTSYLEIVNWLLRYADFDSAEVDGYGNVVLKRYVDPAMLSPVVTFGAGPDCIFMEGVVHEFDMREVPNKVVAVMSGQDSTMTATAVNEDPFSRYSTVRRNRTIVHVEQVSQIETQAALDEAAKRTLQQLTSAVESVEFDHVFLPFSTGQAARLDYTLPDMEVLDFVGVASSKTVKLSIGMPCRTRLRKFVRM